MNERMRELELEAITYANSKVPAMDRYNDIYHSIVRGKFAELIVAECIEVFGKDLPDPTSPDYQLGSLPEVVNRVCNVAEHFGVEE